eukprot:7382912-Prymnesium_polylepis.1
MLQAEKNVRASDPRVCSVATTASVSEVAVLQSHEIHFVALPHSVCAVGDTEFPCPDETRGDSSLDQCQL